jgi:hypothetical protein
MIKHLTPRSEEEVEKIFKKHKHFKTYCDEKIKGMVECAKRDKLSLEDCLKQRLGRSILEYKILVLSWYEQKQCNSFWHSECENRGSKLCDRCCKYYSRAEWDNMTSIEKSEILDS